MARLARYKLRSTWDPAAKLFRLHRGDWGNGSREDYQDGTALFDAADGRSCCVGVFARAAGVPDDALSYFGELAEAANEAAAVGEAAGCMLIAPDEDGDVWMDGRGMAEIYSTNDRPTSGAFADRPEEDLAAREKALAAYFAEYHSITLEFFGDAEAHPVEITA